MDCFGTNLWVTPAPGLENVTVVPIPTPVAVPTPIDSAGLK